MSKKALAALFSLAAILRLALIWQAPFWYDENFTLILSRLPLQQMLRATAGDTHPPLYYLLVWPLGQLFQHGPAWLLRVPSALLSLAALWIFWKILENFETSPRVRVAALVLMAVAPFQLYYAQEARMYTLLELLVLVAFLVMLKKRWGWFGLVCVAILYTQNYGLFYVPSLIAAALLNNWSDRRKVWQAVGVAGVIYLPWVLVLQGQMANIHGSYWMQMTDGALPLLILFRVMLMPQPNAVLQIPLMLGGYAWLIVSVIYALRTHAKGLGTVALLAFGPLLLATLASALWQPLLHYRPLIGITPFLYLLMAKPVEALISPDGKLRRSMALYAACFVIPLVLVTDAMLYVYAVQNKTTDGSVVELAYIENHWQTGDVIIDVSDSSWVNMTPYTSYPHYRVPGCDTELGGLSPATRQAIGMQYITPETHFTRAWILWGTTPLSNGSEDCVARLYHLDTAHPLLSAVDNENMRTGLWLVEQK